jgi:hypothetical protein
MGMGTSDTGIWSYTAGDEWAPGELVGYQVEASDGPVGTVDEASADADDGYVVVDARRWLLGAKVLIPADILTRADSRHRTVHVERTKAEIRDAPEFDAETYRDPAYREALDRYHRS